LVKLECDSFTKQKVSAKNGVCFGGKFAHEEGVNKIFALHLELHHLFSAYGEFVPSHSIWDYVGREDLGSRDALLYKGNTGP
jgi:hypothetical protein